MPQWPRDNQEDLIKFYGDPGSGSMALNLVKVTPPFRMTYDNKPIKALTFHKLAAPSLERALTRIWDYYGRDQKRIDALGISKTAGTYNPRYIRGTENTTKKWSNHAYGAAIDINAAQNGFNMAGNIPIPVIAAFKAEGARWGGDYAKRTDPMHFEFCASNEPPRTFEQWLEFYGHKGGGAVPPPAVKPKPITAAMRRRMMEIIMGYEGKIPPAVFIAPDGRSEISGITQKDHPAKYAELKELLDLGLTVKLRASVLAYYDQYTAPAKNWTDQAGPLFFLSDSILNRGPTGAAEILQDAVGVKVDGEVGPTTRAALAALDPNVAVDKLRAARERYEDRKYPQRRTSDQWKGMLNRWNNAQAQAKAFQKEQGNVPAGGAEVIATTTAIVVGTGAAASARKTEWTTGEVVLSGLMVLLFAVAIFGVVRFIRNRK